MSDTPRTDAYYWVIQGPAPIARSAPEWGDFARQLERELTASKERIRRLEKAAREVYIDSIASDHMWTHAETRNMHALRDLLEEPNP